MIFFPFYWLFSMLTSLHIYLIVELYGTSIFNIFRKIHRELLYNFIFLPKIGKDFKSSLKKTSVKKKDGQTVDASVLLKRETKNIHMTRYGNKVWSTD